MNKNLKLCSILNFIFAGLMVLSALFVSAINTVSSHLVDPSNYFQIINIIFLIATGVYLLGCSDDDITELIKKNKTLILIGIFTIPFNIITAIIVLITTSNIKNEYNKAVIFGSIKGSLSNEMSKPKVDPEIRKIDILLKLGVAMVGISGLIFATTSWGSIPNIVKFIALIIMGLAFCFLSDFSEKKLKLVNSTVTYWLLGMAFFIFAFLSAGYFSLFGNWTSFYGPFHDAYFAMLFIEIGALAIITYKKFNKEGYLYLIYTAFLCSLVHILLFINLSWVTSMLIMLVILGAINLYKFPKNNLYTYLKRLSFAGSFVISVLILFNFSEINTIYMPIITTLIVIANMLYITLRKDSIFSGMVAPFLVIFFVLATVLHYDLTSEIEVILLVGSYALIYMGLMISKLIKNNKLFNILFTIICNIALFILFCTGFGIAKTPIFFAIASIILLTNLIYLYTFKKIDIFKFEYFIQPVKIVMFTMGVIYMINYLLPLNWLINPYPLLCSWYLVMLSMHLFTKEDKLKFIYFLSFVGFLIVSVLCANMPLTFISQQEKPFIYVASILISCVLPFVMSDTSIDLKYKKLTIPCYILLLASMYTIIVNFNLFNATEVISSLTVMFLYICLMFVYQRRKDLFTISSFALLLPFNHLLNTIDVDTNIRIILTNLFNFYLLFLFCINILKSPKTRNIIATIFASILLLTVIFNSGIIMGLYVGVISLLILLLGFFKKEYGGLFIVGLVSTIINIIFQLRDLWTKIPFWLYLLVVGLSLIGFVTYKEIKKMNE